MDQQEQVALLPLGRRYGICHPDLGAGARTAWDFYFQSTTIHFDPASGSLKSFAQADGHFMLKGRDLGARRCATALTPVCAHIRPTPKHGPEELREFAQTAPEQIIQVAH